MKLLIVTLVGSAVAVPIQTKAIYGMGTEVFVGTPPTRSLFGVDFRSSEVRFYGGAEVRSPFFGPIAHSSSLQPARRGEGLVDNVTLAGVHLDNVVVIFQDKPELLHQLHAADSEGVLGIGPQSRFALERIFALRQAQIQFGPTETRLGFDMELINVLPELDELEMEDIAVPVFEAGEGWMTNATIQMGRFALSSGIVQFDPTSISIEVPSEAMRRLVIVFRMHSPEVHVDEVGVLKVPCDASGRISIAQEFEITVGDSTLLVQPATRIKGSPGLGMCSSQF